MQIMSAAYLAKRAPPEGSSWPLPGNSFVPFRRAVLTRPTFPVHPLGRKDRDQNDDRRALAESEDHCAALATHARPARSSYPISRWARIRSALGNRVWL